MNRFRRGGSPPTFPHHSRLLAVTIVLLIALARLAVGPLSVAAQMEYDFNGDGKVTCDDFKQQYPDTYTDEATKALQKYPKDLKQLNANASVNDVACEGQPTKAAPAKATSTPTPSPTPAPQTSAPAANAGAPETSSPETADVPADVMARVAGCAVVAISARDVVGAGCPGVGNVIFHLPDDAPSMQDTVITEAPAAPAAENGSGASNSATGSNTSNQSNENASNTDNGNNTAKAGKNNKDKNGSSDTTTTKNDKNKHKGKHNKHNGNHNKHNGKNKNNKHSKSKKQRRK
jgi:hypothetical protein